MRRWGKNYFPTAKFCLDSTVSHQFKSGHRPFILSYVMWMEQELQKIYLMSAKIRSCLFSRSSVAHIFETYTHKKIAVGRNYVSLSSPSPRWLHFKRLTVVRIILCDKWGVRGGGSFAPGGMPGSLLLWVITPLTKSGDIHSHGHV